MPRARAFQRGENGRNSFQSLRFEYEVRLISRVSLSLEHHRRRRRRRVSSTEETWGEKGRSLGWKEGKQEDRGTAWSTREIILRVAGTPAIGDRPIAPINARVFALKLRPSDAGAKPRPTDG